MSNRGMIKWQPFAAVIPGNVIVNKVLNEKKKIRMPELSEEQIRTFESLIMESFTNQENIIITFFKNGLLFKKKSIVNNINNISNKISFCDGSYIYFKQILNIKK